MNRESLARWYILLSRFQPLHRAFGAGSRKRMFRDLIPQLADDYHVVAPDLPGFGLSDVPDHKSFRYTFDHLAEIIGTSSTSSA